MAKAVVSIWRSNFIVAEYPDSIQLNTRQIVPHREVTEKQLVSLMADGRLSVENFTNVGRRSVKCLNGTQSDYTIITVAKEYVIGKYSDNSGWAAIVTNLDNNDELVCYISKIGMLERPGENAWMWLANASVKNMQKVGVQYCISELELKGRGMPVIDVRTGMIQRDKIVVPPGGADKVDKVKLFKRYSREERRRVKEANDDFYLM